jgi:hypothetical protein
MKFLAPTYSMRTAAPSPHLKAAVDSSQLSEGREGVLCDLFGVVGVEFQSVLDSDDAVERYIAPASRAPSLSGSPSGYHQRRSGRLLGPANHRRSRSVRLAILDGVRAFAAEMDHAGRQRRQQYVLELRPM